MTIMENFDEGSDSRDKDWNKLREKSMKEGYREGVSKAAEERLQEGFDLGYSGAFDVAKKVGQIRGIVEACKLQNPDDHDTLDKLEGYSKEMETLESSLIQKYKDGTNGEGNILSQGLSQPFKDFLLSVNYKL